MLFKKALEAAKKNGVYNSKADSYNRVLQKHTNTDIVDLSNLNSNLKKRFNIDASPVPVFMPLDSSIATPFATRQHQQPFVNATSISKGIATYNTNKNITNND